MLTILRQKDSDLTFLYGPHQKRPGQSQVPSSTPCESPKSKPDCSRAQRPILKKRSVSETLLQRSVDAWPCAKGSAASSRKTRPSIPRSVSESYPGSIPYKNSSDTQDLTLHIKRRIRFNDQVQQCRAVPLTKIPEESEDNCIIYNEDDDAFADDDMMQFSAPSIAIREIGMHDGFQKTGRTITMLPPTTLKTVEHTYKPQNPVRKEAKNVIKPTTLQSPPSVKSVPLPVNFLLDNDDSDDDSSDSSDSDGLDTGCQTPRTFSYQYQEHMVELAQAQAKLLNSLDDFKRPTLDSPPYDGTSVHFTDYYDEDEEELLLQLGCIRG